MKRTALIVATFFGSGLIPPIILSGMAGTYGSIAAIPACLLLLWSSKAMFAGPALQITWYTGITFLVYWLGAWSVPGAERMLGRRVDWKGRIKDHDQNQIVIDEVLGMLIACSPLLVIIMHWWLGAILAFGFFRIFDIVKLWPANVFDNDPRPGAVMLDDAIAGIYAAVALLASHFSINTILSW